jgi:hypothetical protein
MSSKEQRILIYSCLGGQFNGDLGQKLYEVDDPVPTGRQLIQVVGVSNVETCSVYAILPSGDFEDLRLDETYDLRGKGVEQFIIFETDRVFKIMVDHRQIQWGATTINGKTIKLLAGVDGATHDVWLRGAPQQDRLIEDDELVDVTAAGLEKFVITHRKLSIIVNGRPKEVNQSRLSFVEIIQLAFPDEVFNETIAYTVTFTRGPSSNPEGSLVEGASINLKNGMVFNATATDKS